MTLLALLDTTVATLDRYPKLPEEVNEAREALRAALVEIRTGVREDGTTPLYAYVVGAEDEDLSDEGVQNLADAKESAASEAENRPDDGVNVYYLVPVAVYFNKVVETLL